MPGQIRLVTGDTMPAHLEHADGVVFVFSHSEIESGRVGDAVDRLMTLTDTKRNVLKFADAIMFEMDGYDDDPREVAMIPACKAFFQSVTSQWSYWLHFLAPDDPLLLTTIALLVPAQHEPSETDRVRYRFTRTDLEQLLQRLGTGMRALHSQHGIHSSVADLKMAQTRRLLNLP